MAYSEQLNDPINNEEPAVLNEGRAKLTVHTERRTRTMPSRQDTLRNSYNR